MNPRILCIVPFCTHGTRRFEPGTEFICAMHWRLVPRRLKLRRARLRRLLARAGEYDLAQHRPLTHRAYRLSVAIWRRMKRAAIEGAST